MQRIGLEMLQKGCRYHP